MIDDPMVAGGVRGWSRELEIMPKVPSFLARIFKGDYTAPTDEVESYTEQYNP